MSRLRLRSFILVWLVFGMGPIVKAADNEAHEGSRKAPERVGGNYIVSAIERKSDNIFTIVFESEVKTGRFDTLVLESDHVHVGVELGAKLRISAEILHDQGIRAEVSQILLFLPAGASHVPVWMISRKAHQGPLKGAKYLEMHAPTSDYTVF